MTRTIWDFLLPKDVLTGFCVEEKLTCFHWDSTAWTPLAL